MRTINQRIVYKVTRIKTTTFIVYKRKKLEGLLGVLINCLDLMICDGDDIMMFWRERKKGKETNSDTITNNCFTSCLELEVKR